MSGPCDGLVHGLVHGRVTDGNNEESVMEEMDSRMRIEQALRQLAGMDHMYITISHIICYT